MPSLSRRTILFGAASSAMLAVSAPGLAQYAPGAPGPARFSSVQVDVSHLRAIGLGPYADLIAQAALAEAQRAFADRLGGAGPALVIRLTALSLNSYVGSGGSRGFGGSTDYLEGEALIVGPRGEIIARHPQLVALPSSYGGAWYDPLNEEKRAVGLARTFADWLRRDMG